MKTVLVCVDKFKGTLSSQQASQIISSALRTSSHAFLSTCLPMSDGGDGFLAALSSSLTLSIRQFRVAGPLEGQTVVARYGIVGDPAKLATLLGQPALAQQRIGVIEIAECSGMVLISDLSMRNPLHTTSSGAGQLLQLLFLPRGSPSPSPSAPGWGSEHGEGCDTVLLGLGGSATNDAALAILPYLGFRVTLDGDARPATLFGRDLPHLHDFDFCPKQEETGGYILWPEKTLLIAVDVDNVFLGSKGAVAVFSPQKGASRETQKILEAGMERICHLIKCKTGVDISAMKGGGAAGGISATLSALFPGNKRMLSGSDLIAKANNVEEAIRQADVVITGEGRFDRQTLEGKAVGKLIQLVEQQRKQQKRSIPIIIVAGMCDEFSEQERQQFSEESDIHIFDLVSYFELEQSMKRPAEMLERLIQENVSDFISSLLSPPSNQEEDRRVP